ncbi:large ATP-binding protein [Herbaspirillum huttiense]|uniref:large ATP-binding protein n=1 Tax=Herbaspirillum huttiense TaxID=863372 RepID=UPI00106677CA|nr:large ATP-binding protein [Herbaspirillum huttiense]QBP77636.1 large ATP-binding protein [Herbaspirillum huttiense]
MTRENVDWLGAIVKRANMDVTHVDGILAANNIKPSPVLASPRHLRLVKVEFSGEKIDVPDGGAFTFSWSNLDSGLWALLTEGNLVGKSSVLEIIKWLIRGRAPSNLQDDVKSWIHAANLQFTIDETTFTVNVETRGNNTTGRLERLVPEKESIALAAFRSEAEFESVMSDFFLRTLSMDHLTTWREIENKGETVGTAVTHGWAAFSGAMFIGTDYSVLLGDLPVAAGINARLMQMFLGIPWVSTLGSIKLALKAASNEKDLRVRQRKKHGQARERRKDDLQLQLDRKLAELSNQASDDDLRAAINILENNYADNKKTELSRVERLERDSEALRQAEAALIEDRRDLQSHLDSSAADGVFRLLDPSCCPRCDHAISDEKKNKEKLSHACSVCGEAVDSDQNADTIKAEIDARVGAAKAVFEKAQKNVVDSERALVTLRDELSAIRARIQEKSALLGKFAKRNELVLEVAVLRGRLQEVSSEEIEDEEDNIDETIAVLTAAEKETDERVKAVQGGILAAVSERIVHYAQRFGMQNLTKADLKGGAQLYLVKGGVDTSYSKVTEGEKLRLKVATVLAMMEVAEIQGVGRHPGLLLVDSPGAQEVSPDDLDQLVSGLAEVAKTLPYFQVFVAAAGATSNAITKHVPLNRRRTTLDSKYLW